jgi:hypothetical protein
MAAGLIQAAVAAPLTAQLTATEQLRLTGMVEEFVVHDLAVRPDLNRSTAARA